MRRLAALGVVVGVVAFGCTPPPPPGFVPATIVLARIVEALVPWARAADENSVADRANRTLMLVDMTQMRREPMRLSSQIKDERCAELRAAVKLAKSRRNDVIAANARADSERRPWPTHGAGLVEARLGVEDAAREARRAGCDIDDLVGPYVGQLG
jgi:hypothetical protein